MKQIFEFEIENLKCSGCANSIQKALQQKHGVELVVVDLHNKKVTVEGTADRAVLLNTLSSLGYPEKGSNSLTKKAVSYISCMTGKI
ncbi:MAG: heavy metal-associated domain-containing protein [Chitinophagales bacterium]|nr:heavy-metal-associated domain-containing protein [Chitinophagales bacterium]MDW8272974.1 heavy metal-associated domain-containing protein [Chitinophagales bacterium]